MKVVAFVEECVFTIHCGDGTQPVKWLGSVAIARYEPLACVDVGAVVSIVHESTSRRLNFEERVVDCLEDGDTIRVITEHDHISQN